MALSAIASGLRGTCGLRSCVPPAPVTAQVTKTSRFMASGIKGPPFLFLALTQSHTLLASGRNMR